MHRRPRVGVRAAVGAAAVAASVVAPLWAAAPAPAAAATTASTPADPAAPGPPNARAWVLADADTGAVLAAYNDHVLLRPASTAKIMTGLMAVTELPADATVPVGPDAAGTEAAKINMKAGQVWSLDDSLHSLLMVSANDAAVALADRLAGSEQGFADQADRVAKAVGTVDSPVFNDPAGLDDSFAFGGGDFVSAYDMAVLARAAMAQPLIRQIVGLPVYEFVGPDGVHHRLRNHNRLLLMDPTVVGVKPGYTKQAGDTYVAEAVRGGRSMIVVELDATPASMYSAVEGLFAQGFATPVSDEPALDHLPPIATASAIRAAAAASPPAEPQAAPVAHRAPTAVVGTHRSGSSFTRIVLLLLGLLTGLAVIRRRRVVMERRPARRPASDTHPGRPPGGVAYGGGGPVPVRRGHDELEIASGPVFDFDRDA